MHDKLKLLLEQIQIPKDFYVYFKDGNLDKILGNKNKDKYTFHISLDKVLPLDVYLIFLDLLQKKYNSYEVKLDINYLNQNINIDEYFNHIIKKYIEESPILSELPNCYKGYCDETIYLELNNKSENLKFKQIKDKIVKDFKNFGLRRVEFDVTISKPKKDEIQEEIDNLSNMKVKKAKKETKVLFGEEITTKVSTIKEITYEINSVSIEGYIFDMEIFDSPKVNTKILTLKVHDHTDSMLVKMFFKTSNEITEMASKVKIGNYYKIRGYSKNDNYAKDIVLIAREINSSDLKKNIPNDDASVKRVEFHAHTHMSQMDSVISIGDLVNRAVHYGHRGLAITDHNSVQSFPDAYSIFQKIAKTNEDFKLVYGVELSMVDDDISLVVRPKDRVMLEETYIVFDVETTGFNAYGEDQIIEIGAVKLFDGKVIDSFSKLIDPKRKLVKKITEITGITDEMLKGQPSEEEVVKEFLDFIGDYTLVAHNAKFDISFLESAIKKYKFNELNNTVLDTLELSRTLEPDNFRHSLSALVKRYDIPFDEDSHHRAEYDAKATALIFHKMLTKLNNMNIENINQLDKLLKVEDIFKFGRAYHINVIAKNRNGLKNLFKLVSLANTTYLYKTPKIPRTEIMKLREDLLIGSGCYESEIFNQARSKSDEELSNLISFYDYVEVQPIDAYHHLIQMNDFANEKEIEEHIKKIVRLTKETGKMIIATGDVHHLDKEDKLFREILVNQKVPGGGRHPLARNSIYEIPSLHYRTTNEMLEGLSFLEDAYDLVVTNPNSLLDQIEKIEVFIDTKGIPFSPKIDNSKEIVTNMVYDKAKELYGDDLPSLILERIEKELNGIVSSGFDVIYLISQKLVKKSNDDGYPVGSRGSVGSSLVATLMGITEVNPLPAHYVCPSCKHSLFELNNEKLYKTYSSGYDLPDLNCPKCNNLMNKEGQDIPFATFLGFEADKVPDIDLNFSGDYQNKAHDYTKELFGEDNVFRAGTIGTVADKTAFGFVKGYCEEKNITLRSAEMERLAKGCTGAKRTTGQHPGGIVVVPNYMEVFDITPYQYPADDSNSSWRTTHFDFHSIDQALLKLDILGHDDPTMLKKLQDLTNKDMLKINMDDEKVLELFRSPNAMGVTKEQINCETGSLGLPEFGTTLTVNMLHTTQPKKFSDLVKLSGLSHGTDVWTGNAEELIKNKICDFDEVIGCRDDIMIYLMNKGMEPKQAFKIMEFVRKGKPSQDKKTWDEFVQIMNRYDLEEWYVDSCTKIKYMFPKAHAVAYVMSAFRIAWFKLYYPLEYYAVYFSVRSNDFDVEIMQKGYNAIKNKYQEIMLKQKEASNKELSLADTLSIALEASARGIKFGNIDLYYSDAKDFVIKDGILLPPFRSLDGLGDTVANKIKEEREKNPFLSVEDFQKRAKVSSTLIDKMKKMKILDDLDESSQLSLF